MSQADIIPTPVLVVESGDGQSEKLASRLRSIGMNPIRVDDLQEAAEQLEEPWQAVNVVMIPASLAAERVTRSLKGLSRLAAGGLTYISYGDPPDRKWRKRLRSAGVTLALWEPYDDALLRFQVNRALGEERETHHRDDPRVPTYLFARVSSGGRSKDGIVYSLSTSGAFMETPRPNMEGASVEIEIRLPGNPITLPALVRFVNVPGNLQQPILPHGMGLRFTAVDSPELQALHAYINERLTHLEV